MLYDIFSDKMLKIHPLITMQAPENYSTEWETFDLTYKAEEKHILDVSVYRVVIILVQHIDDNALQSWHQYVASRSCKEPEGAARDPAF